MSGPCSNWVADPGEKKKTQQNRGTRLLVNCFPMKPNSKDNQVSNSQRSRPLAFSKASVNAYQDFRCLLDTKKFFYLDHLPCTDVDTILCHQICRLACTILTARMTHWPHVLSKIFPWKCLEWFLEHCYLTWAKTSSFCCLVYVQFLIVSVIFK